MKLGFIGYGNMASAIVEGIINSQLLAPEKMVILDAKEEKQKAAQEKRILVAANLEDLLNNANIIFLCVKPKDFTQLLPAIKATNIRGICYLSIAAGITIDNMVQMLGDGTPVIRTMPNTPLLVGKGTTAICRNQYVSNSDYQFAMQVFEAAGTVYELEENQLNDAINLNGSAPAYIFNIAQIVAQYAYESGNIPFETGLSMFCDTLQGSAAMIQESGQPVKQLIEAVSSPGGTTVAALESFKQTGLENSLRCGLEAAVKRAYEMGENK